MMKIHQMLAKKLTRKKISGNIKWLQKMNNKCVLWFSLFESVLKKDDAFDQNQTQNLKSGPLRHNKQSTYYNTLIDIFLLVSNNKVRFATNTFEWRISIIEKYSLYDSLYVLWETVNKQLRDATNIYNN